MNEKEDSCLTYTYSYYTKHLKTYLKQKKENSDNNNNMEWS